MRRVLAILVAVALIGGAYAYRTRGDGDGGIRRNGRTTDGPLTLVCTTELAEVCQAIADANDRVEIRVEPAWATFDRQNDVAAVDFDVWLAAGPWPQMLNQRLERTQQEPIFGETVDIASAPLVTAVYLDDLARLPCAADVTWRCLGAAAVDGTLRLGSPNPDTDAAGIAVVAAATGGALDDSEYARNDLGGAEEAFVTAFGRQLATNASTALQTMLATPALLDARADASPLVTPVVAAAASRDRVRVVTPKPTATLVVTAGAVDGGRGEDLLEILGSSDATSALEAAGWQVGSPPDSENDGLPSPGVLEALRELLA